MKINVVKNMPGVGVNLVSHFRSACTFSQHIHYLNVERPPMCTTRVQGGSSRLST